MIVLVGGTKGGTGKSTIATNIAAYRLQETNHNNLLIIDTDTQGNASRWAYNRNDNGLQGISCIQLFGKNLQSQIPNLEEKYDDIVIDAGGYDSKELRISMTISDVMCTPAAPSLYDLDSIDKLDELYGQVIPINSDLVCNVILNKCRNIPNLPENEEALDYLQDFEDLNILQFMIHERISFSRSAVEGRGVNEMKNDKGQVTDPKAIAEIKKLYEAIYE